MISIKITNAYILTMNETFQIIEHGCICIENDIITYIGDESAVSHLEADTVIDAQGNLVMPGLINGHTHAAMSIYKGMADDMPLKEWLEHHIFPTESEFCTKENVETGARLGIMEMIMSGTTCFADMYYFTPTIAEVCKQMGIRALLGQAVLDFKAPDFDTPVQAIEATQELIIKYANHSLVKIIPAPHSPYTCSAEILQQCRKLANEYTIPLHIHVSETIAEYNTSLATHNLTPVQYLNSLGMFDGKTIAAHCVYISDEDRYILAEKRVHVVNNPQSNMKLVSGISPVPLLLQADIPVCLGTDSSVSNNSLDMFQEMKVAALIHKLNQSDASVLPARDIVYMCTRGAAKVLGIDHKVGSIEVGKQADIILVNINQPHLVPLYSIYSHIVYAMQGHDVDTVIINGAIVYLQKQFQLVDPIETMIDAQMIANAIMQRKSEREQQQ